VAHATHFLERLSRVHMHHADIALALYRDPARVRYLLGRLWLPPEVERVALALSREPEPPHVIVGRDGGFVTCLAGGMGVHDAWTVPREHLAEVDAELQALREAAAKTGEGGARALLSRLYECGHALSREEFQAIDAWIPLFEAELWNVLVDVGTRLRDFEGDFRRGRYRRLDARMRLGLQTYWNLNWSLGHLAVLLGRRFDWIAERLERAGSAAVDKLSIFMWPASRSGVTGLVLRGAWAASRAGRRFFDAWIEDHDRVISPGRALYLSTGLTTLALRHPERRDAVREALLRQLPPDMGGTATDPPQPWAQSYLRALKTVLDDPEHAREVGARALEQFNRHLDPESRQRAGIATAFTFANGLFAERQPGAICCLLPAVADASAFDLYLPADLLPHWPAKLPDELILDHLAEMQRYIGTHAPQRAELKPGRNDPCACGSGKKFKRCCAT
jgi:hypothetical protein